MGLCGYIAIALILIAIATFLKKRKKGNNVAAGIEVYSQNGKTIFSSDMMFCRVLGKFEVDGSDSSFTDTNIANREIFIVVAECERAETDCSSLPVFTFAGNTISWVYTSTNYNVAKIPFKGKYYYGVMGGKNER